MAANRTLVQSYANPVPFYAEGTAFTTQLGQVPFAKQVKNFQVDQDYQYKCLMNDIISIQVHTDVFSTNQLCICDHNKKILTTYTSALNLTPYLKGRQVITDNAYTQPIDGWSQQLRSYMWSFRFLFKSVMAQYPCMEQDNRNAYDTKRVRHYGLGGSCRPIPRI